MAKTNVEKLEIPSLFLLFMCLSFCVSSTAACDGQLSPPVVLMLTFMSHGGVRSASRGWITSRVMLMDGKQS